jgi:hypothetical protein
MSAGTRASSGGPVAAVCGSGTSGVAISSEARGGEGARAARPRARSPVWSLGPRRATGGARGYLLSRTADGHPRPQSLLACIVATALGLSMVLRSPPGPGADRLLGVRLHRRDLLPAGFLQSIFLSAALRGLERCRRIAVGVRLLAGALVPSAALGFFLEFLGGQAQARRTSRRVALFSALLGLAVALTPLATSPWGRAAVTVWAVGGLLLSVSLLIRRVRRSDSPTERARLTYLAIGAAASLLFSALDGLSLLGLPFPHPRASGHHPVPLLPRPDAAPPTAEWTCTSCWARWPARRCWR